MTAQDVQDMLKEMSADTLQEMLEAELDTELGYPKNGSNPETGSNRRNGHTKKSVRSEYGELELEVPRDRDSEAIKVRYPNTEIQKCVVHQIRNSIRYVSYKDTKKLLANLKLVYTAPTEDAALSALDDFEKIWGTRYPLVVQSWRRNWDEIVTFFKYPPEIRKLIYTTNMIESYHRQFRKVTKGKAVFPNDESLLKLLYLITHDVMLRWTGRIHYWGQILLQLSVFFPDRVKSFLC